MVEFIDISKILSGKEGKVSIHGWLHHKRSSGGILFLLVRDGTGLIQSTLTKDKTDKKIFEEIESLPIESLVELTGTSKKDTRAPGGYEIVVSEIKIEQKAAEDFPIAKKYHGPDFLLDQRHFWIRSEQMQMISRLRDKFLKAAREWFSKHGFVEIQVPIIVGAACEGGSTLFELKYFDQKAYLTQSWQLYAEAAIASIGKCFTVAPSFRAEKSRTRRHLTEYWHLEAEEPWCDLEGTMKTQEELLTHILHTLTKEAAEELKFFKRDPKDLLKIKAPFKRMTYDEAVKILQEKGVKFKWGDDIAWEQEKILTEKADQPFFLTHFPLGVKAFYHKPDPKRQEVTLSADLLGPEGYGEITGGGQRIHDYPELMKRIKEEKLDTKSYQWYVDLRRYGMPPHSGFGLGIERTVAWICKLEHIRDAILFPRLINRVYP
jgi:asparaginyl-tRNA synthetase